MIGLNKKDLKLVHKGFFDMAEVLENTAVKIKSKQAGKEEADLLEKQIKKSDKLAKLFLMLSMVPDGKKAREGFKALSKKLAGIRQDILDCSYSDKHADELIEEAISLKLIGTQVRAMLGKVVGV